jgi:hypothetical protein
MDAVDEEVAAVNSGMKKPFEPGENPVVYMQFKTATSKKGQASSQTLTDYTTMPAHLRRSGKVEESWKQILQKPRSPQQISIASEIMDQTLGVIHVFPTVLIFACWHLSKDQCIQSRLRRELRAAANDQDTMQGDQFPDPKVLEGLPVLNAVVMETLRLNGPNTGQELRITPKGRQTKLGQFDNIPGGVIVSSSPFCLHRAKEVFPDPDEWHPERWLPEASAWHGNGEAQKWFWAFSSGPRGCPGNLLAQFCKTTPNSVARAKCEKNEQLANLLRH